jgi:hypothetical protein
LQALKVLLSKTCLSARAVTLIIYTTLFLSSGVSIATSRLPVPHTHAAVEEERNPEYARAAEDTNRKYRLLSKLGWGSSSTVLLAKNMKKVCGTL